MQRTKRINCPEDGLFLAGWIILAIVTILVFIKNFIFPEVVIIEVMRPCYIHQLTGLFCPGCGGSRSVAALLHGRFLVCGVNYPLVAYAVIMYLWFMISQTIQCISKNRCKIGLRWRNSYLWIALGILIAHFVLKNIFYIVTGIEPFLS